MRVGRKEGRDIITLFSPSTDEGPGTVVTVEQKEVFPWEKIIKGSV